MPAIFSEVAFNVYGGIKISIARLSLFDVQDLFLKTFHFRQENFGKTERGAI